MSMLSVAVAILQDQRILLIKREDFEVWALPGGEVDSGESLAQAAVREVIEETGLNVHLTRLVGIYSAPQWEEKGQHVVVFAGYPVRGTLCCARGEILEAEFFNFYELPDQFYMWHHQFVLDTISGFGGSAVRAHYRALPPDLRKTRQQLYTLRDQKGLSRQQAYISAVEQYGLQDDLHLEVDVTSFTDHWSTE